MAFGFSVKLVLSGVNSNFSQVLPVFKTIGLFIIPVMNPGRGNVSIHSTGTISRLHIPATWAPVVREKLPYIFCIQQSYCTCAAVKQKGQFYHKQICFILDNSGCIPGTAFVCRLLCDTCNNLFACCHRSRLPDLYRACAWLLADYFEMKAVYLRGHP